MMRKAIVMNVNVEEVKICNIISGNVQRFICISKIILREREFNEE